MPFKGRGRSRTDGRISLTKLYVQIATGIPSYKVKDQHRHSHILHHNQFLLIASEAGVPLCLGVHLVWDRCTSPTPVKPTPGESDSKTIPQEDDALVITQHQARKTSLWWMNRKLWLLPWASTRASTENGWRFQVTHSESGCLPYHMHLVEG